MYRGEAYLKIHSHHFVVLSNSNPKFLSFLPDQHFEIQLRRARLMERKVKERPNNEKLCSLFHSS